MIFHFFGKQIYVLNKVDNIREGFIKKKVRIFPLGGRPPLQKVGKILFFYLIYRFQKVFLFYVKIFFLKNSGIREAFKKV